MGRKEAAINLAVTEEITVAQYDLSTDFSIFARPQNELYEVLRVMKRIGALIAPTSNL